MEKNVGGDCLRLYIRAKNWTCGEICNFDVEALEGANIRVDWGDGHVSSRTSFGKSIRFEHSYSEHSRKVRERFTVRIESEHDGDITGFRNGSIDMDTERIDLSGAGGLQRLYARFMANIDVTPCKHLKWLDISAGEFEQIDLSQNTELEKLECRSSKLTRLNLSKCDRLERLSVPLCHNLRRIAISNNSALRHVELNSDTPIDAKSMSFIRRAVERNGGEIIDITF